MVTRSVTGMRYRDILSVKQQQGTTARTRDNHPSPTIPTYNPMMITNPPSERVTPVSHLSSSRNHSYAETTQGGVLEDHRRRFDRLIIGLSHDYSGTTSGTIENMETCRELKRTGYEPREVGGRKWDRRVVRLVVSLDWRQLYNSMCFDQKTSKLVVEEIARLTLQSLILNVHTKHFSIIAEVITKREDLSTITQPLGYPFIELFISNLRNSITDNLCI
jgi:hypothetical protein